ncbi:cellulose biosynthesis protein BcsQ [Dyella sp. C9]|uniref:cellulose biosynthesis protein BcsQ n=1 Tax=Dyella sp. C9 TaxID=2202154 RepID=UPI000DF00F15|nr:cellulose biosynthesis protein BcsQ [Dyella sp. C9]
MKTIALVSSTGGAGRTTLTVALAGLLKARGHAVVAIECDPGNVLATHYGLHQPARAGLVSHLLAPAAPWRDTALQGDDGVLLLPWGDAAANGQGGDASPEMAIATRLLQEPHWLRDLIARIDLPGRAVALVDTPAWPSVQTTQALAAADLVLAVLAPEPLVCATLPRLRAALAGKPCVFVANGVMPGRQLHMDILTLLRASLGTAMSSYRIHADTGIPEALARDEDFCRGAPHSQAAHDMQGLASWLAGWVARQGEASIAGGAS